MENNYEHKNVDGKTAVSGQAGLNNSGSIHSDNTPEVQGDVFYEDKVIKKIIGTAVEKIDGLLTVDGGFFSNLAEKMVNTENVTSGIEAEVGEKQVAVDMDVVIEYGQDITEIADQIRKVIRDEVAKMTHLEVIEVNIHVVDIKTKAEFEEDSETVQDKVTSAAKTTGEFTSKQTDKAKDAIGRGADKAQEKIEDNQETRVN